MMARMATGSIYVDDQTVELPQPTEGDLSHLGGVLAAAKQHLEPEGRVVVEVALDGKTLDAQDLERQDELTLAGKEVRLYTAEPRTLATETLEQVRAALTHAGDLQEEAADLIQQDEGQQALEKVGEAVQIWLQVQQAVQNAAVLVGVDLDTVEVDGEPMTSFTNELIDRLGALKEAIANQDTVGLADTLGYEWPQIGERWDRLIGELIRRIKGD